MNKKVIIDELEFEVPYGKLAAKTWHEETDQSKRILLLHGWMDNAGSFDHLAPLLSHKDGLYIVALDLPGHGKSSQLPVGTAYSDLTIIMEVRRCLRELGWVEPVKKLEENGQDNFLETQFGGNNDEWRQGEKTDPSQKKFTIIGHSLGAGVGLYYSSLFPREVESIVLLDFIKSRTIEPKRLIFETAATVDSFINIVPAQSPFPSPILSKPRSAAQSKAVDKGSRTVSQEAAIIATIDAHKRLGTITRDDAICLMKRSTVAVSTPPNSVIYSRDLRLNSMLNMRENWEINRIMFSNLKGHILACLAKSGLYTQTEEFKDKLDLAIDFIGSVAKSLKVQWVEGDHYFHMGRATKTAEIINKYIESPMDYAVEP